ncbi:MAG TPA: SCP2 sterol-binding domain-containing protein [Candidatus Binatia bacterium]|nr:SCP2 sterol-binding domain-containing protein [Candidatus Binatia bacterium]
MSDVTAFLQQMTQAFDPSAAAGTNCVIQFNTSKPAYITINNGACKLDQGTAGNSDVTLTMADDDLVALLKGELNGMMAFMTGKLQVEGDLMLGQRLASFFDRDKLK